MSRPRVFGARGYGRRRSGLARVTVRTGMPRVTAAMWDWWFG
ncbi:DAPG hydrolase family protein [Nocardia sputorum]